MNTNKIILIGIILILIFILYMFYIRKTEKFQLNKAADASLLENAIDKDIIIIIAQNKEYEFTLKGKWMDEGSTIILKDIDKHIDLCKQLCNDDDFKSECTGFSYNNKHLQCKFINTDNWEESLKQTKDWDFYLKNDTDYDKKEKIVLHDTSLKTNDIKSIKYKYFTRTNEIGVEEKGYFTDDHSIKSIIVKNEKLYYSKGIMFNNKGKLESLPMQEPITEAYIKLIIFNDKKNIPIYLQDIHNNIYKFDLKGRWNTEDSTLTLKLEDNVYTYNWVEDDNDLNKYHCNTIKDCDVNNIITILISYRLYYEDKNETHEFIKAQIDPIVISCNDNTTIVLKDNDANEDYFSKYIILKIDDESKFGQIGSTLSLNTNWKNSKLNRSGIIYNFEFNDQNIYKDENYCDKIIDINNPEEIGYNEMTYSRLIDPVEYTLTYNDENDEPNYLNMYVYEGLFEDNSVVRISLVDPDTKCVEEYIFEYKDKPKKFDVDVDVKQIKLYICDINYNDKITDILILVIHSTTNIQIYKYKNNKWEVLYNIKNIVRNDYVPKTTQVVPVANLHELPQLSHNLNDHNLHKHKDIIEPKYLNNHGDRLPDEHIHNFFDDHHHTEDSNWYNETDSKFEDNDLYNELNTYQTEKANIDNYVDTIIYNIKKYKIPSINNLITKINTISLDINDYFNYLQNLLPLKNDVNSSDVKLKLTLRNILYKNFLNPNPLSSTTGLPCMYYSEFNCPINTNTTDGHCQKITDDEKNDDNLHSVCIPETTKQVDTCLDLYGKNNCEQHYITNEVGDQKQCIWSEFQSETDSNKYLGKCSEDGNVSKIKESCADDYYLIKKFGKGELSETLIDSICLPKNENTKNLLYDNPNYINTKHIKDSKGGDIERHNFIQICKVKNEVNAENLNEWNWDFNQCYNLEETECHKNSKEVCNKSRPYYLDKIDESNKLYDINKNKICHWRPLHYSKDEDSKYTEKGICENLL
jgi:hypothetical protein